MGSYLRSRGQVIAVIVWEDDATEEQTHDAAPLEGLRERVATIGEQEDHGYLVLRIESHLRVLT